jgi:hypothetical protein
MEKVEKNQKIVMTIDGTPELRDKCRYIKGGFYRIGDTNIKDSGQCYLVEGKYCRSNTSYIVYDHGLSKYIRKKESLIYGIIGLEDDKCTPIYGYFSPNPIYNVKVQLKNYMNKIVLEESILNNSYYRERLSNGHFYHISTLKAVEFNHITINNIQKRDLPYDSKGIMAENIVLYNNFNNSKPSKFILNNYKHLGGLTFGFEFETVDGNIPKRITSKLGLIPLRDGSIRGLEYVTIPLSGAKGLQTIVDIAKELKKRTIYDNTCSMHLHIGNIPRTKEFIIALYRVLISLEDEIYKCFPLYKKYNYGVKHKDYTKPLPILSILPYMDDKITDENIVDNFELLYRYFSMGQSFKYNFKSLDEVNGHPSDPEGRAKWQIHSRYHAHNFIQLLFGNKQTIEFRIHNSTDDSDVMLNFLFLNATIINFTKKYTKSILNSFKFIEGIDLNSILRYDDLGYLGSELVHYYNKRKIRIKNNIKNGDLMCNEENMPKSNINWDESEYISENTKSIQNTLDKSTINYIMSTLDSSNNNIE